MAKSKRLKMKYTPLKEIKELAQKLTLDTVPALTAHEMGRVYVSDKIYRREQLLSGFIKQNQPTERTELRQLVSSIKRLYKDADLKRQSEPLSDDDKAICGGYQNMDFWLKYNTTTQNSNSKSLCIELSRIDEFIFRCTLIEAVKATTDISKAMQLLKMRQLADSSIQDFIYGQNAQDKKTDIHRGYAVAGNMARQINDFNRALEIVSTIYGFINPSPMQESLKPAQDIYDSIKTGIEELTDRIKNSSDSAEDKLKQLEFIDVTLTPPADLLTQRASDTAFNKLYDLLTEAKNGNNFADFHPFNVSTIASFLYNYQE